MVQSNRNDSNAKSSRGKKLKKGILKVGKSIVKGAKVGKAAVALVAKQLNPVAVAKTATNLARGKGLTLRGSNYIGPGNPMGRKVKTKTDKLAKEHDQAYDAYIKKGIPKKDVYLKFSDADKKLMKKSDVTTSQGLATYTGMKAKQLLHKAGLTGKKIKE